MVFGNDQRRAPYVGPQEQTNSRIRRFCRQRQTLDSRGEDVIRDLRLEQRRRLRQVSSLQGYQQRQEFHHVQRGNQQRCIYNSIYGVLSRTDFGRRKRKEIVIDIKEKVIYNDQVYTTLTLVLRHL